MFGLLAPTRDEWFDVVMSDFGAFLQDHASCEKKAAGMALSMLAHYPDRKELVREMVELAREEMEHFAQVFQLLDARDLSLGKDGKDPYVNQLRGQCLRGTDAFFLDQLLLGAIIEARGCERFQIVANRHPEEEIRNFYQELVRSEARHRGLFLRLARTYFPVEDVNDRYEEMLRREEAIIAQLPLRPALH